MITFKVLKTDYVSGRGVGGEAVQKIMKNETSEKKEISEQTLTSGGGGDTKKTPRGVKKQMLYQVSDDGREWCDIYFLPNGSVPLKKSFITLIFGVFNVTQLKYGDLRNAPVTGQLVEKWFPPGPWGGFYVADAWERHGRRRILRVHGGEVQLRLRLVRARMAVLHRRPDEQRLCAREGWRHV